MGLDISISLLLIFISDEGMEVAVPASTWESASSELAALPSTEILLAVALGPLSLEAVVSVDFGFAYLNESIANY